MALQYKFLDKKIKFLDIYEIIKESMNNVRFNDNPSIEEILKFHPRLT